MGSDPPPGWFEVVFVCTGNRARSPFAAELLARLTRDLPVSARSVGVLDLGPVPALPEAVRAADEHGIDLASHRARGLPTGGLTTADLVIGFEQFHVAAAVVEGGAAKERAFLITELAEMMRSMSAPAGPAVEAPPEQVIELAHSWRAREATPVRPVSDPLGRSRAEFRTTFEQIDDLVSAIAESLFGASRRL